eukprot:COSAG06_NODE_1043_length_10979_cov_54.806250_9_plen_652_part_00
MSPTQARIGGSTVLVLLACTQQPPLPVNAATAGALDTTRLIAGVLSITVWFGACCLQVLHNSKLPSGWSNSLHAPEDWLILAAYVTLFCTPFIGGAWFVVQTVLALLDFACSQQPPLSTSACLLDRAQLVINTLCITGAIAVVVGPQFFRTLPSSKKLKAWLKAMPNKLRAWLVGVRSRLRRGWFVTVHRRELAAGCKAGNYLALVITTPSASPLVQWGSVPLNQLLEHGYYSVQLWERGYSFQQYPEAAMPGGCHYNRYVHRCTCCGVMAAMGMTPQHPQVQLLLAELEPEPELQHTAAGAAAHCRWQERLAATKAKEEELDAYGSAGSTPLQAARQGLTPAQWGLGRYGAAGGSTPLQAAQRRLAFAALQLTHTGRSSLVQSDDVDVVDLIGEALAALTPFRAYAMSWYQEDLVHRLRTAERRMIRHCEFDNHDRLDIGVFGAHALSPGTEYLMGARPATLDDVQTLVSKIGGRADATLQSFPDRVFIGAEGRHQLQSMLDREHSLRGACGKHVHDLKLTITRDELLQMISNSELARIEALYCAASQAGGSFNQIKLRRVEAMPGKCIPFHTDVGSTLTMQVPLNDDSEYDGGRLMFATASGIFQPVRPGGSATIHESHVVHGVSQMLGGVRYGLFLLRNTEGAHAGGG